MGVGRKFGNDFRRRMFLFDRLIASVLLYGAEMYRWKEWPEIEAIQTKYVKWCLRLERSTPNYIVLEKVKRDRPRISTGARAMSYEETLRRTSGRWIAKECLREKKKEEQKQEVRGRRRLFIKAAVIVWQD